MPGLKDFNIISNNKIAEDIYELRISGDTSGINKPGQFVNIQIKDCYLRRPISVCDKNDDELTLIYKIAGGGTKTLSGYKDGEILNLLTGLGNGFDIDAADNTAKPLVVGGGVGAPPMFWLTKDLIQKKFFPVVVLGFNSSACAFYIEEFSALGVDLYVSTVDGSIGTKGFVTDAVAENNIRYGYTFSCGPLPLLKAVYDISGGKGQFCFEERMACGFGACMGCSCKTKYGSKRICKDGPVLTAEEIIW